MHTSVDIKSKSAIDALNNCCIIFDVETTGLNRDTDRITELAAIKLKNGKLLDSFNQLINPEIPIPARVQSLTGITDEMVKNCDTERQVVNRLLQFFSGADLIIGHNVQFDLGMLDALFKRNGCSFSSCYIDTLAMARKYMPNQSSYKLTSLADTLKIDTQGAHRAMQDVKMTLGLLMYLAKISNK